MQPNIHFWAKCADAFQAGWKYACEQAREDPFKGGRLTARFLDSIEIEDECPRWSFKVQI